MRLNRFKIRGLMAKKKINTQSELALMLGISKSQLSYLLSDKFDPIKSNIVELAKFLGVSPKDIIEENKDNK